jgi:hypothetical protein
MPPRVFTKAQGYRPIDLLHAALDHLFSANVLFSVGDFFRAVGALDIDVEAPRCLDSAGYLSHLGIELYLKALLLRYTGNFRDDHSLTNLFRTLEADGVHLALNEKHVATVEQLDQFYHLRYPQTAGSPSVGGLDWLAIHSLSSALGTQLPKDLQRDVLNLDRTKKFGRVLMKKQKVGTPFEGNVIVVDTPKKEE